MVLRGLGAAGVTAAVAFEERGIRCYSLASAARARAKPAAFPALLEAGVPVPRTDVAPDWHDACRRAGRRDGVLVKTVNGSRGTRVLIAGAGALPARLPFPGPYPFPGFKGVLDAEVSPATRLLRAARAREEAPACAS